MLRRRRRGWRSSRPRSRECLLVALAGAGLLGFLSYDQRAAAAEANDAADELRADKSRLTSQLDDVQQRLSEAQPDAQAQYDLGYKDGQKDERELQKITGTYDDGYKDGYLDAFTGFSGDWEIGTWYLIKIAQSDRPALKYSIDSRYDITQCRLMYLAGDQLYTRGSAC